MTKLFTSEELLNFSEYAVFFFNHVEGYLLEDL